MITENGWLFHWVRKFWGIWGHLGIFKNVVFKPLVKGRWFEGFGPWVKEGKKTGEILFPFGGAKEPKTFRETFGGFEKFQRGRI